MILLILWIQNEVYVQYIFTKNTSNYIFNLFRQNIASVIIFSQKLLRDPQIGKAKICSEAST